jgi:hypothetical protein
MGYARQKGNKKIGFAHRQSGDRGGVLVVALQRQVLVRPLLAQGYKTSSLSSPGDVLLELCGLPISKAP